MHKMVDQ